MKDELREFLAFLARKGFKATRPRRAIAEVAFSTHKHFTLEDLIRMKEAAGRPHDLEDLKALRLLQEKRRPPAR